MNILTDPDRVANPLIDLGAVRMEFVETIDIMD
jgi:hypothetical protein